MLLNFMSLPARGAWIEIRYPISADRSYRSLPARGAWIEMSRRITCCIPAVWSLPARGAWIEISLSCPGHRLRKVAPREGSVD